MKSKQRYQPNYIKSIYSINIYINFRFTDSINYQVNKESFIIYFVFYFIFVGNTVLYILGHNIIFLSECVIVCHINYLLRHK